MLVEPAVDGVVVAGALERGYGRIANAVRFVPAGETAWCFTASDDLGARWFIKLARPGVLAPARIEFAGAVSRAWPIWGCRYRDRCRRWPVRSRVGWMGCGWRCSSLSTARRWPRRICEARR